MSLGRGRRQKQQQHGESEIQPALVPYGTSGFALRKTIRPAHRLFSLGLPAELSKQRREQKIF